MTARPAILRGMGTILVLAGAVVCHDATLLLLAWLALWLLAVRAAIGRLHARLLLTFVLPLLILSVGINGLLLRSILCFEFPLQPFRVAAAAAVIVSLRISVIAAAFQVCLLPLAIDGRIVAFLQEWRLPIRWMLIVTGALTMFSELTIRTRQAVEARMAQGLTAQARWRLLAQLPAVLMPVMVATLDSAAARAQLWYSRGLVDRLARHQPEDPGRSAALADWMLLLLACDWATSALWWDLRLGIRS